MNNYKYTPLLYDSGFCNTHVQQIEHGTPATGYA
jgi:hypothetical protein